MIPLFMLPLDQLKAEHVRQLVDERMPEGQNVEFKETLPASKNKIDRWLKGHTSVGDYARDEILAEIVAFANSGGGNLVLGIVESADHPKRAVDVNPLPRSHELADRFRLAARDCIDPRLPALEVRAVENLGKDEDSGVVVFRIPASRSAPHRLEPKLHCYLRRADRTEKMTMTEIQDMSVRLARGLEAIRERFEESHQHYLSTVKRWDRQSICEVGARVSVLPVGGSVNIDRVYQRADLKVLCPITTAQVNDAAVNVWVPGWDVLPYRSFRPILRGGMRIADVGDHGFIAETVFSDGLVQFAFKQIDQGVAIVAQEVLGLVANALLVSDTARRIAGAPGAELILDVELRNDRWHDNRFAGEREFLLHASDDWPQALLGPQPIHLPLKSVTDSDQFSLVLRDLLDDLRNACGIPHVEQFEVDLSNTTC